MILKISKVFEPRLFPAAENPAWLIGSYFCELEDKGFESKGRKFSCSPIWTLYSAGAFNFQNEEETRNLRFFLRIEFGIEVVLVDAKTEKEKDRIGKHSFRIWKPKHG